MTALPEPTRLLDSGPYVDEGLRDMLRAASTRVPSAAQLDALARKVNAATATPSSGLGRVSLKLKLGAALCALTAAAWFARNVQRAALALPPRDSAPAAVLAPAVARERVRPTPRAQAPTDARPAPEPSVPQRALQPTAARARSDRPAREPAARPKHAAPAAAIAQPHERITQRSESPVPSAITPPSITRAPEPVPAELSLLGAAQRLLVHDPAAALTSIDECARAYPNGEYVEEREALAIDALRRLGRRPELQARARAFLQRFPKSPHRERIAGWLQ